MPWRGNRDRHCCQWLTGNGAINEMLRLPRYQLISIDARSKAVMFDPT